MTLSKFVPVFGALVVAAFVLSPAPAAAAQQGGHTDRRSPSSQQDRSGRAVERSAPRQQAAPSRSRGQAAAGPSAPRQSAPQGQPRYAPQSQQRYAPQSQQRSAPQGQQRYAPQGQQRYAPQGQQRSAPQGQQRYAPQGQQRYAPLGQQRYAPQGQQRYAPQGQQRYAPGRQVAPSGRADRFSTPVRPSDSRRNFSNGWNSGGRLAVIRPRFEGRVAHRPYYSFRSRLRIGFGISLGYAVALPTWYTPYLYEQYPVYGQYGGVSFDIEPYDAALYVDGAYMGGVADFGPSEAPLMLAAGRHHIDLSASGCQPVSFDLTVLPGQVLPYQGTLPLAGGYTTGDGY